MVTIRSAEEKDRGRLGAMGAGLVHFHHALDPARFLRADNPEEGYGGWLVRESQNPQAVVIVAEIDGRVIGYSYGRFYQRNWNDLLDAHGKLDDVFVDPSDRRTGAGRALVEEMCVRLRALGAPRIVLSTAVANEAAQRLFESLGFRTTMLEMTRNVSG